MKTVAATLVMIIAVSGGDALTCISCDSSYAVCKQTSETVTCTGSDDTCMTKVYYDATKTGRLGAIMGCNTTAKCDESRTRNGGECDLGVVATSCTNCCTWNNCNSFTTNYVAEVEESDCKKKSGSKKSGSKSKKSGSKSKKSGFKSKKSGSGSGEDYCDDGAEAMQISFVTMVTASVLTRWFRE